MENMHFDSLHEFMQLKASDKNRDQYMEDFGPYGYCTTKGEDWWGILGGLDAVKRACSEGWREGAAKLSELSGVDLTVNGTAKRRRIARRDFGNELDIHAVYRGDLDRAWTMPIKQERPALAQVTLLANLGAKSNLDARELFWRGLALLKACDILSRRGHDVQIVGFNQRIRVFRNNKNECASYSIVVKPFGRPLDLPALASTFCLAGFQRYYGWMWSLSLPRKISENYGRSDYGQPLLSVAKQFKGENVIVVPGDLFSKEAAEDWLVRLEEQLADKQAA